MSVSCCWDTAASSAPLALVDSLTTLTQTARSLSLSLCTSRPVASTFLPLILIRAAGGTCGAAEGLAISRTAAGMFSEVHGMLKFRSAVRSRVGEL